LRISRFFHGYFVDDAVAWFEGWVTVATASMGIWDGTRGFRFTTSREAKHSFFLCLYYGENFDICRSEQIRISIADLLMRNNYGSRKRKGKRQRLHVEGKIQAAKPTPVTVRNSN